MKNQETATILTASLPIDPQNGSALVAIYWIKGDGRDVIAENNAGTFCYDDWAGDIYAAAGTNDETAMEQCYLDELAACRAAGAIVRADQGVSIDQTQFHRSSQVLAEMRELGWI